MSQAADERMGEAARERDAVERHFARSILAMLTVTPDLSYGNGERGQQAAFAAAGDGPPVRAEESPPSLAAPVRPGSALTGAAASRRHTRRSQRHRPRPDRG